MARTKNEGISLSWVVSLLAVVSVLLKLLVPAVVVETVPGAEALGSMVSETVVLTGALAVGVLIFLGWVLSARFGENSANSAEGVAERVEDRFETFLSEWFTVFRLALAALLTVAVAFLSELGTLAGDIAGLLGSAPMVVSQSATAFVGWLALGGDLPVIGPLFAGLTPPQWALISLFLLVVGVSWRNA